MRLRRIVVTALLSLFAGVAPASSQLAADNPIVLENQQPGSSGWFWSKAQGYQTYVIFVAREGRPAPFLYQHSIATGQAYNNYPNDGRTGKSLYYFNSYGANTVSGNTSAVKVSFDRPYADSGSADFFN